MKLKKQFLNQLSLFTSFSTLICCALPSLLVMLGLGVAVSGLVSVFPQIIWLSEHKGWVFGISGSLIVLNWILYLRPQQTQACDIDAGQTACAESKDLSFWILALSTALWMTGAFFAFLVKYFI